MAQYSKDEGIGSVALFVTDAPPAIAGTERIGGAVFGKAGVDLKVVPIPRGTPDVTSEVTAAMGDRPEGAAMIGDATHCTAVLKALETVGGDLPTMLIQPCVAQSVEDAVPGALQGAVNFGSADIYSEDEDTKLYRTVMARYAPETPTDGYAVTGFQSLLGLVRATEGMTGDITGATITAQVKAAKDVLLPAGHARPARPRAPTPHPGQPPTPCGRGVDEGVERAGTARDDGRLARQQAGPAGTEKTGPVGISRGPR